MDERIKRESSSPLLVNLHDTLEWSHVASGNLLRQMKDVHIWRDRNLSISQGIEQC